MAKPLRVVNVDLYTEVPVSIEDLEEDPDNIRLENQPDTVEGLSRALEHGGRFDVAPRVWRTADGKLRALAGSARVRAAKRARGRNRDLQKIPVVEVQAPESRLEKVLLQFSENALRDNLGPVDYGRGLKMLVEEGLTYDQILEELTSRGILPKSRSKAWISQMIQLTELDADVQLMVNRGEIGVWQALQLSQLPHEQQKVLAERIANESPSRPDLRIMVDHGLSGEPSEAVLQETRDLLRERAEAMSNQSSGGGRRLVHDADRRHGRVVTSWTLLSAAPRTAPARSKITALQKSDWFTSAAEEEQQLAIEAVAGGHSVAASIGLVQRAVAEAPAASQTMRDLLVLLRQVHQVADSLQQERDTAPAEFARLRLQSLLNILSA
jgi:ParB/Sulfiredoxin domain